MRPSILFPQQGCHHGRTWSGRPSQRALQHVQDPYLSAEWSFIESSAIFGGFLVFWTIRVVDSDDSDPGGFLVNFAIGI